MIPEFLPRFDRPENNVIVYDGTNQCLKTVYGNGQCAAEELCVFVPPRGNLRIVVRASDGAVVGLECADVNFASFSSAELSLPSYSDGRLTVSGCGDLCGGCNYIVKIPPSIGYDGKRGLLCFGEASPDCVAVRVCENLFVGVDGNNALRYVFVALNG